MNDMLEGILEKKIITIVRGTYGRELLCLSRALYDGGIRFMEVTFDQSDPACLDKTAEAIAMLDENYKGAMHFGAGTVLSRKQVDAARSAGAGFIISPNTDPDIIKYTRDCGLISIPGAMTPSEILTAHNCGADLVKLFPAATLGERYVKDILAPISHVKIIATAGITEDNFRRFLELGLKGAGISGRLTDKKLIAAGDWMEFTRRAETFVNIAAEF